MSKNREIKRLVAELNMFESEKEKSDYDRQSQECQINQLKKKFYEDKKRQQERASRVANKCDISGEYIHTQMYIYIYIS